MINFFFWSLIENTWCVSLPHSSNSVASGGRATITKQKLFSGWTFCLPYQLAVNMKIIVNQLTTGVQQVIASLTEKRPVVQVHASCRADLGVTTSSHPMSERRSSTLWSERVPHFDLIKPLSDSCIQLLGRVPFEGPLPSLSHYYTTFVPLAFPISCRVELGVQIPLVNTFPDQ